MNQRLRRKVREAKLDFIYEWVRKQDQMEQLMDAVSKNLLEENERLINRADGT